MVATQQSRSKSRVPPKLARNGAAKHGPVSKVARPMIQLPPAAPAPSVAPAAAVPPQASLAGTEGAAVLGQVLWLLSQSPAHRHLFLADVDWAIVPPIALRQFFLWKRNNMPVGYACWATVCDPVAARIRQGMRRLAPADWKSGDQLWLVDLVTPFGGRDAAVKELREKILKDKRVKLLQPGPDGKGVQVVEW